jgi:hypothetical protein
MRGLSRAGEPLFVAGPLDDLVAVAEACAGLERAVLVPKPREALLELVELVRECLVVSFGKKMPELGAAFGRAIDLGVDLIDSSHVQ